MKRGREEENRGKEAEWRKRIEEKRKNGEREEERKNRGRTLFYCSLSTPLSPPRSLSSSSILLIFSIIPLFVYSFSIIN